MWADGIELHAAWPGTNPTDGNALVQPPLAANGIDPRHLRLPIDVVYAYLNFDRIALYGGEGATAWHARVGAATLSTEPQGWRGRRRKVAWRASDVHVALPPAVVRHARSEAIAGLAASGEAYVYGSFRRPRRAELVQATVGQLGLAVTASGQATLSDPNAPVSVQLSLVVAGDAPLAAALLAPPVAWRQASASAVARYTGTWRAGRSELQGRLVGPSDGAPQVSLVVALAQQERRWTLTEGQLRLDERPVLAGHGDWQPERTPALQAEMTAVSFSPQLAWAALAPLARPPLQTSVDGNVSLVADVDVGAPERWRGAVAFELTTSGASLGVGPTPAMRLAPARWVGRVEHERSGRWRLPALRLQVGDDVLHVEGAYVPAPAQRSARPRPQAAARANPGDRRNATVTTGASNEWHDGAEPGFDGIAWSEHFALDAISPIAGLPYGGPLRFGAALKLSPTSGPFVQAVVEAEALHIGPIALGACSAELTYEDASLRIADFAYPRAAGHLRGQGAISFAGPHPTFLANAQLTRFEASEAMAAAGLPPAVAKTVRAPLWGEVAAHGSFARPEGHIELQAPRLQAAGLSLGKAECTAVFGPGPERVRARVHAHPRRGDFTAELTLRDNGHVSVVASSEGLPLLGLVPGLHPGATASARLALRGPPDALDGALVADVQVPEATRRPGGRVASPPLEAAAALNRAVSGAATPAAPAPASGGRARSALPPPEQTTLQALHLVGRAANGAADLQLSAVGGAVRASGTLQMRGAWPLHLAITAKQLPARELGHWFPDLLAATGELGLLTDGQLVVDAPLGHWQALTARLALQSVTGRLAGAPVALAAPVTLRLHQGLLQLPAAKVVSKSLRSSLTGRVRLWPMGAAPMAHDDAIGLHAVVDGELAALSAWVPALTAARGAVHANVDVHGSLMQPSLLGEAEVQAGTLRLGDQPIDKLAAKVVFSGRAAALTSARAELGRGRVSAQGEWTLGDGGWLAPKGTVGLRITLDRVPARPLPDAQMVLTGNLELTGTHDALRLHGDLHVDSLRYTAKLDLDRLVPKRRAPPLKATFLPFARPVALAIKLRAQNDAIVSSKVVEAELTGDLLLTGTSDRVGLLGSISPLWARARYRDNVFTLSHATVDFTDEYRIAPVYSIEGHTRACQMDASVTVAGDSEGYSLTASGRDEHGLVDSQDVFSCLHMGVRLSDFAGAYGHTAGFGDALSGSFDALWTVSGLDDKVRKFLPIRVDELRLTSGWSSINQRTTPRVVVGRDIGHGISLRYVRAIDELNDQAITLEYKLKPNRVIQGGYMSARDVPTGDFGLDLRLQWELP